jgi:sortase A
VASGTLAARRGLEQFATRKAALAMPERPPDQRLWSPERVRAWRESLSADATAPLAVLRIPRLELEVPVLSGTADWTLNRAVGHIDGTARPGAAGNSGIAGHRDGFFRGLKDVQPGDVVEIETLAGVSPYRVDRIWIVGPDDVSVLDPTPTGAVTLVTCYPFYFVGSAPQRFIVRAVRIDAPQRASARTPE